MTISSLAKIIVGVNRMVVENVEIEYNNQSSGKNKTNGKTPVTIWNTFLCGTDRI